MSHKFKEEQMINEDFKKKNDQDNPEYQQNSSISKDLKLNEKNMLPEDPKNEEIMDKETEKKNFEHNK